MVGRAAWSVCFHCSRNWCAASPAACARPLRGLRCGSVWPSPAVRSRTGPRPWPPALAQLVGAPALPAFQLARSGLGGVGLVFQLVVHQRPCSFERALRRAAAAPALALPWPSAISFSSVASCTARLRWFGTAGSTLFGRPAVVAWRLRPAGPAHAQLVGPYGYWRQRRGWHPAAAGTANVNAPGTRPHLPAAARRPAAAGTWRHAGQLALASKASAWVCQSARRCAATRPRPGGVAPRLGGQDFNALGQQHGGLARCTCTRCCRSSRPSRARPVRA